MQRRERIKIMRNWTEEYNALPHEVRIIGSAMDSRTRINQLKMEKMRLKLRYIQSLKEVNDHIKNLEKWIQDLEKGRV